MACCHQATSHYLSQCWPRYMSLNGVTRPQRVKAQCVWMLILLSTYWSLLLQYFSHMIEELMTSKHHWCCNTFYIWFRNSWSALLMLRHFLQMIYELVISCHSGLSQHLMIFSIVTIEVNTHISLDTNIPLENEVQESECELFPMCSALHSLITWNSEIDWL